ncbi:MAG: FAD-dependent oxidoreductase [Bacilli bacterium]
MNKKLNERIIETDFCVIGGGMAGISAAITAARLGVKTVIIHERPVFGGNASGEIRMWICGVQDYAFKETGLLEEISLENYFYNPDKRYPLWDSLLYGKVVEEENLTAFLNCTCFDAKMCDSRIESVTAYQMTTQSFITVKAKMFADCSGDSILAPLTGAKFDYGREGVHEYGEYMIQNRVERDNMTMGSSCLIQARKTDRKVEFRAPVWAEQVSIEKLKSRAVNLNSTYENFWYIEIGGYDDVIKNAEDYNRRLIALCLGIWDTIKNSGEFDADYFDIDFIGFLAAKRESRRMKGDYVMTANDIINRTVFPDEVAYGGWPLDDHNPYGFDGDWGQLYNKGLPLWHSS